MSFVPEKISSVLPAWTHPYVAGSVAAATVIFLLKKLISNPTHKSGVPLPPGPPAKWFWESTFPDQDIPRRITPLFDEYGPVVSLRRGNHLTVIIGRMDAATEILEKEGGATVDRPRFIAAGEILSGGMRLVLTPAGERFRRLRRTAHTHLQPKAAEVYEEIQAEAAKDVILDLMNKPKEHMLHALRFAVAVILKVTYGKTSQTFVDDPEVLQIREITRTFQETLRPGAYLVDRIPWLKSLPGYDSHLQELHRYERDLFREQLNKVKENMAANNARPSFVKTLLEHVNDHKLSSDEMAYLAGSFFGAGTDTTASSITVLIMAAACHPEAQARVQEELDRVVGMDRVPTFEDKDMLPELQAFLLEALRWRPVSPLGFLHRTTKDIIWKGLCIPSGTPVLGCHWAISRDPDVFPDPETFNPKRWLTDDGRVRTDLHFYTYGFGRRVCSGIHVANRSLYINLAYLLWSFRIRERPEAPIVTVARDFQNPALFRPAEAFDVEFIPRMEAPRLREMMAKDDA